MNCTVGDPEYCWHGVSGHPGGPYTCCKCNTSEGSDLPAPIAEDVLTDIEGILADGFGESLRRAEIERISYDLRAKKQARGEIF